jgi:prepilin-type N-terminal cleavage/methylation domain-containing protein
MLSLKRQFRPDCSASRGFLRVSLSGAFTLVEILIALAVLGTMSAGAYIGFNSVNTYSVTSRLYSEAQTAVQNQIDLVLSKEPFDVKVSPAKVPVELMTVAELDTLAASGVTFPTAAPTATPATTSSYYAYYPYYRTGAGQPILKQAFIYADPAVIDPVTGKPKVLVTGTLMTTITDVGDSMTLEGITTSLNTRRATVSATYTFRNNNYNLSLDTMRTADR